MIKDKDGSELLRAANLSFARWELPSFDEDAHVVARDENEAPAEPETPPEPEPLVESIEEVPVETVQPFTLEQLEQIRQEAYNEGFATGEKDGFHAGQLKAKQEADAALAAQNTRLETVMSALLAPIAEQDQQIEEDLLTLLKLMVKEVIGRELKLDSSQIRQVVQGALKLLPMGAQNIRLHLHPHDFEAIKQLRERHEEHWKLLEDDQLLPGGCRVETEHSRIDASVEARLELALKQLFEQQRVQATQPPSADIAVDLEAFDAP